MNKFYTYAYLREDGTPYYIGKGIGTRIYNNHRHTPVPPIDRILYLKKNLTEEEAYKHEEYLISVLGRKLDGGILINLMSGGGAPHHSEETREKIRAARARQVFTRETNQKRAASNTGKRRSTQQRFNISEGQRKAPITFVNDNGAVVTTTLVAEFCREHNLTHSLITKVVKGNRKSHKGWRLQ